MHTLALGYRGMSLLLDLNWDRLLYAAMVCAALSAGAHFGVLLLH